MTDPRPADAAADGDAVAARPATAEPAAATAPETDQTAVAPVVPTPVERPAETPAAQQTPPPRHGNRLVASIWVLFAMLLFQVGYILLIALLVLLLNGPTGVAQALPAFVRTPYLTWLPVVVFGVLYEIAVLILGRAGRFAYVVASLVVGLAVFVVTGQGLLLLQQGTLGSAQAVTTELESPVIILIGVLAREVMLWTGFAVGARGTRVRRRDRRARREFDEQRTGRV